MTTTTLPQASGTCTPAQRVTRSLLGYGAVAGPFYVAVTMAQAFTREGFDLTRHQWSLLANGTLGWIHITNLVLTGLMTIAFAAGLGRALPGTTWAPRLVAVFGASLVTAGAFKADPAMGFPAGTPDGPRAVSWHGMLHLASGAVGFTCLAVACFLIARQLRHAPGWARFSRATGVLFLAGFTAVATGAGAVWANLAFTAGVLLVWAWLAAVSVKLYRTV
ncbi:hypothetical protein GCM10010399_21200 [Dactylosporangium fulvum]|uniref:DUF998 domain-containing protein n=1 Tax=Dactylosporangium fulvum TaxID=53359 RepID=A0ABY5W708_9ACTN|nr:DUF998 domain-containing protein [Dactylosporangium fulvum]UWP84809.1 DUF998 domain-containing protein [Dactylosporangium fulvum]